MHLGALVVLGLGLWTGFWPTFSRNPLSGRFPAEAQGDLRFQVDAARFFDGSQPAVDICLSIPSSALGAAGDSAQILAVVQMLSGKGKPLAEFRREMSLRAPPERAEGTFPVPEQWLRLTPSWVEGTVGVRVRIEDRTRLKIGALNQVRGRHRAGEASARLSPDPGEAGLSGRLSDLLFAWGQAPHADSTVSHRGLLGVRERLQPNPFRYYGLYQPILSVYWERYPPRGAGESPAGARLFERQRVVRLADSLVVHLASETTQVSAAPAWTLQRLDVTGLAAGSYRFEVTLWDSTRSAESPLAIRRGDFQVVWERKNWILNDSDLLAYGRVLLPAEEYDRFASLDRGGMETYLRDLWNRYAPARSGEENLLEQKFLERVRHANEEFRGLRPGMLSDRGRVYVQYGPPDAIREQLNPQDQELLWITLPQEMAEDGIDNAQARAAATRRRSPVDNRAYQIWEYFLRGDPLIPEYVNPNQKTGLKFIFVDELGNGDYTLAYSNVKGAMN